ncbi:unnamed protein product [Closterium sp. NIES-65]|nr:unnamed protein product [Closterium sp. NIES-65]
MQSRCILDPSDCEAMTERATRIPKGFSRAFSLGCGRPREAAVLQECEAAWNMTFSGWTAGGDCLLAELVGCDAEGKIDTLNFSGLHLNGTIPTSIATLTALTQFDFTTNNFAGTFPSFITRLSQLYYLDVSRTRLSGTIPRYQHDFSSPHLLLSICPSSLTPQQPRCYRLTANTNVSGSLPASLGALANLIRVDFPVGVTCGRAGSSCEIQQNASSFFCRVLCFDFCASCIPINASRVFNRARCPKFPVSLVAQAKGGWSEASSIGSSSSGGQRYKAVSPLEARQVWFVVRRGNDELSTDFQKEVATLCANTAAAADHAVEQAEEEQVLVFEWVPGGNLHCRLVAEGSAPLSVWQCLDVTGGVLRGLKHIQSHGVVHGRIHPRNILLDTALQVRAARLELPFLFMYLYLSPSFCPLSPPSLPGSSPIAYTLSAFSFPPPASSFLSKSRIPPSPPVSIGVVMLQLITGRPALIPRDAGNDRQGNSSGTPGGSSSNSSNSYNSSSSMSSVFSDSSSVHIRAWAHHMVSRNMTAQLRAAHLPSAPDAIMLPMVRLALSCTASDPLSRPTVTDLLRSIKALKRSLSALPRPALPGHTGASRDGDMANAAGSGGPGEKQGGEGGDGLSGGFSLNALDAKLDWLLEDKIVVGLWSICREKVRPG